MPKVTVTPTSARGQRARAAQRAHARARQRRIKRIGLGLVIVALVALGGAWWLVGRDATSQSEVLHTFTTQDFHSLAFDPDDPDTIYFGHHQGLQVSHDAGRHWQDATLHGVHAMQLAMPAADPQRRYAAGHN